MLNSIKNPTLKMIIANILVSYVSNYKIDEDNDNITVTSFNSNALIYLVNKLTTFNYKDIFDEYQINIDINNKLIQFIKN